MFGFWEMMTYVLIILVGFFYVWKKGILTGTNLRATRHSEVYGPTTCCY